MNDPESVRARLDDVYSHYAGLRDGVGRLQRDLEAVQATVRSPDGMVTVVVGPGGAVRRVELHERAYEKHPPQRLAELITQAASHATMVVSQLIKQRIGQMIPEGTGMHSLLERHDRLMGYPNNE